MWRGAFERVFGERYQALGRQPSSRELRRLLVEEGDQRICRPVECASLLINARLYGLLGLAIEAIPHLFDGPDQFSSSLRAQSITRRAI
jgi:hypothetical protein